MKKGLNWFWNILERGCDYVEEGEEKKVQIVYNYTDGKQDQEESSLLSSIVSVVIWIGVGGVLFGD